MGLEDIMNTLTLSIILLAACIVIVAGVGIYLGVYRRRKIAAEERRDDSEEAEAEEQQ